MSDNEGLHPNAIVGFGPLLLDEGRPSLPVHFVTDRLPVPKCGALSPTTRYESAVTCVACRQLVARRQREQDRALLKRLAQGPVSLVTVDRKVRYRLESQGLARVVGGKLTRTP